MFASRSTLGFRFCVFFSLSFLLMLADSRLPAFAPVRSTCTLLVAPFHYLVDAPVVLSQALGAYFSSNQKLMRENEALKANVLALNARLQGLVDRMDAEKNLKKFVNSSHFTDWFLGKFIIARLLAIDLRPFVQEMLIDKGKRYGVYVGQPVIDSHGVVGQVIAVNAWTSRILLVTDVHNAVPVQIKRTGFFAIAEGTGRRDNLSLAHVPDTVDIKTGDEVVTSGLDLHYPVGYPLGRVRTVKHSGAEHFAQIEIAPSAHLYRGRQVLLVWPKQRRLMSNKSG